MIEKTYKILTTREVCKILRISRPTLYKLIEEGHLKGVKCGRDYRFKKENIDQFLEGETND